MEVKSVAVFLSSLGGLLLTPDGDGVSTCVTCPRGDLFLSSLGGLLLTLACVTCPHGDLFLSSLGGLLLILDGDGVSTHVTCPHGDLCSFTSFDANCPVQLWHACVV